MEKGKKEEGEREDGKEDVTEIGIFFNFQGRAEMNCVCVCVSRFRHDGECAQMHVCV